MWTDSELISDLRRVARLIGHSPSSPEYARHGRHSVNTLLARFGGSWAAVVAQAGLRYTPRRGYPIPSTEELVKDIKRVAAMLGHPPNRMQYQEWGRFEPRTVISRAGVNDWSRALAGLAGYDLEEVLRYVARGKPYQTTEQWLARLRALARQLGHAPSSREAGKHGISTGTLYERVGGTWADVLRAAGLDMSRMSVNVRMRATATAALLADVLSVAARLGRAPSKREYGRAGKFGPDAISRRMGGWSKVKQEVEARLSAVNSPKVLKVVEEVREGHKDDASAEAISAFFRIRRT